MNRIINLLPPLGIGYVAAVLETEGFQVEIIDCPPLNLSQNDLSAILTREKPAIIGVTATTVSVKSAITAAQNTKALLPNSLLVIGGPHLTALPEETMRNSCFDVGVVGEGEYSFLELAQKFRSGSRYFSDIRGLICRDNEELIRTGERAFIKDLDSLPFPALHLFPPLSKYHPMPGNVRRIPYVQMITSRGCPYQCTFCDRNVFGERYRMRSSHNVVDEVERLIGEYGVREVKFNDDTFTINQGRVIQICEEMLRRNLKIVWACRTHVRNVSKALLRIMRRAGCWQIGFGIEAGDHKILGEIKKSMTLEEGKAAIEWAKKEGINVKISFMFGLPGETKETILRTIEFAKTLKADIVNFHIFIPFPGTELFKRICQEGTLSHRNYQYYCQLNLPKYMHLPYIPQGMTEEQVRQASIMAHKAFYLRPSYIYSQLIQIRSIFDIYRYWQAFLTIINL